MTLPLFGTDFLIRSPYLSACPDWRAASIRAVSVWTMVRSNVASAPHESSVFYCFATSLEIVVMESMGMKSKDTLRIPFVMGWCEQHWLCWINQPRINQCCDIRMIAIDHWSRLKDTNSSPGFDILTVMKSFVHQKCCGRTTPGKHSLWPNHLVLAFRCGVEESYLR